MGDIVITPASNDVNSTGGTLNIRASDAYPLSLKTSNVERILITAAGLVGIGTTAPTGKLHIYSSITGDTLLRADGTNGTIFSVTDDLSNSLLSVNNGAGIPVLEVFADDSVVMGQYGSGDFVLINNKVGIGTTNPSYKLDVRGSGVNARVGLMEFGTWPVDTTYIYLQNNSLSLIAANYGFLQGPAGETFVNAAAGQTLHFRIGNSEKWAVTSAGILQSDGAQTIRTSTGPLTLATNAADGHIILSPNGNGNVGINTTTPDIFGRFYTKTIGFDSAGTSVMQINGTSYGGIDLGAAGVRTFGITSSAAEAQLTTVTNIPMLFNISGTTKMALTSVGLGIGITNPTYKLEVNGNFAAGGTSTIGTTYPQLTINGTTNQHAYVVINRTNYEAGVQLRTNGTAKWYMYMPPADDTKLIFASQSFGDSLTIKNNGYVGIGTTNPTQKLHLYSATDTLLTIDGGSGYEAGLLLFASGIPKWEIYRQSSATNSLNFYNYETSSSILTLTSSNVGVGITNPSTPLHVFSTAATLATFTRDLATDVGFSIGADSNGTIFSTAGAHAYLFYTNGTEKVRITSAGLVGIGTASPTTLLSVGGAGSTLPASGITFGGDAQANLYRVTEDTIRTDGSFIAAGSLDVGNGITSSSQFRLGTYLGYISTYPTIATAAFRWVILGPYNDTLATLGNGLRVRGELFFSRGSNGENLRNARLKVNIAQGYNKDLLNAEVLSIDSDSVSEQPILYSVYLNGFTSKYFAIDAAQLASFSPSQLDAATVHYNGQFYDQSNDARSLTIQPNTALTGAIGVVSRGGKIANSLFAYTGNIGIGTAIPNATLQIAGTTTSLLTVGTLTNDWGGVVAIGTTNGNGIILSKVNTANDTNRVLTIMRDDTNGASIFGYTPAGTSTSVGFQIRASASSYFNGGNVGIGTTNPSTKLHVYGAGGGFEFGVGSSNCYIEAIDRAATAAFINTSYYTRGTGYFAWNNGSYTERMRIDSNGNVGIGVTIPLQKLHVVGAVYGTTYGQFGTAVANGTNASFAVFGSNSTSVGVKLVLDSDANRNDLVIASTNGNVGINIAAPTSKLHVVETTPTGSRIQLGSISTSALMNANLVNDFLILTAPFNAVPASTSNNNAKWGIKMGGGSVDAPDTLGKSACIYAVSEEDAVGGAGYNRKVGLALHTSPFDLPSVERFRITNIGNVGIGVTNPSNKLQISGGGISFTTSTGLAVPMIGILPTNIAFVGPYNSPADGNSPTVVLFNHARSVQQTWFYASGTIAMSLNRQGRFHIGDLNNAPNSLLSVGPSSSTTAVSGMCFGNDASANLYRSAASTIKTDGSLTVVGGASFGGNVGIGVTNPDLRLHIDAPNAYPAAAGANTSGFLTLRAKTAGASHGMYMGVADASPFGSWIQCGDSVNSTVNYPLLLNPNGGNVGIGLRNPATKLEVYGVVRVSESSSGGILQLTAGASAIDIASTFYGGSRRPITFTMDGEKVRIAADGNVGIGTDTPLAPLHVGLGGDWPSSTGTSAMVFIKQKSSNVGLVIQEPGNASFDRALHLYTNGSLATIDATYRDTGPYPDIAFVTSGTVRARINSDGKVGIGTNTPLSLLAVGAASSTTAANGITLGGDSVANLYRISASRIKTDGFLTIDGGGGGATNLLLNRSSSSNENGMAFTTAGSVDWYYYVDNATTNLQIQRSSEIDAAPRVRFNGANSDILFNLGGGNIGVGTATPTGKLHIYSTITGQTLIRADGTNGTIFSVIDDLSDSLLSVNNSAGIPVLEVFADDRVVAGQYGSGDFVLINNKVGLGTSNPANKLTVIGGASIGSTAYNIAAPSNGLIVEGNVGIGTTSPGYLLHLYKADANFRIQTNGGNNSAIVLDDGSSYGYLIKNVSAGTSNGALAGALYTYTDSSKAFQHIHNGTPLFTILAGGNVGIGVTNPSEKLIVNGNIGFAGDRNRYLFMPDIYQATGSIYIQAGFGSASAGGGIRLFGHLATTYIGGDVEVGMSQKGDFLINTHLGGTRLVTVKQNGNVGIGLTTPAYKLQVSGDVSVAGTNVLRFGTVAVLNTNTNPQDIYANIRVIRNESTVNADGMYIGYGNGGTTAGHLRFYANSTTERMRIQANDGFVGIGTDTAAGRLDVYNDTNGENLLSVRNNNSGVNALSVIVLRRNSNTNGLVMFTNSSNRTTDGGAGNSTLRTDNGKLLVGAGGTTYHSFETNGNVGIGLTNPVAARLHIKGDGSNPVLRVETALLVAGTTTASKTFVGWMPMQTGALSPGDTVFIPLFK